MSPRRVLLANATVHLWYVWYASRVFANLNGYPIGTFREVSALAKRGLLSGFWWFGSSLAVVLDDTMTRHRATWLTLALAAAALAGLTGCEDSARQPVVYHPPPPPINTPAPAPAPAPAPQGTSAGPAAANQPPAAASGNRASSLSVARPSAEERLAAQVEALYEQAQRELGSRAGDRRPAGLCPGPPFARRQRI